MNQQTTPIVPGQRLALEITLHSWWDIRGPFEWAHVTTPGTPAEQICSLTVNGWSGDQFVAALMMHRALAPDHMAHADRLVERVADYFIGSLPIQARLFDHPKR